MSNTKKDPAWKYTRLENPQDVNSVTCIFCEKVTKGGIYRAKQHLVGGFRNATACKRCPKHVREELRAYMSKKKDEKEQMNLVPDFDVNVLSEDDEEVDIIDVNNRGKKIAASSGSSGVGPQLKKLKQKGPMDAYFTLDPEKVVEQRKAEKGRQTTINDAYKKESREHACKQFARWMYDAGIPFNAVKYDSFAAAVEAIGQYGPGMKPPSYYEVRVPLLKSEKEHTQKLMKSYEEEWAKYGCSVMADGWKDKRERILINFLVNCPRGTMFVESVDASSYVKSGEKMFELLDKFIQKIGAANVLQVVTDSASNNVLAGKLLEAKYSHLYWSPCAAHCIDLMLEDIWKLAIFNQTMKQAVTVSGYIYNHTGVLNMMRQYTRQKELLRPAKTRFATAFITLSSIHKQKNNLRKMFTSEDWTTSKWAREAQGKRVAAIIISPSFWNRVVYTLKVAGPLIHVLRLVDGEKKPLMGYIYEAMDRAKEAIANTFKDNEEKYKEAFEIIDRRWEIQLHRPLHAAGYYFNPEFFYSNPNIATDEEIIDGLYNCIARLIPDGETQDKIMKELPLYRRAEGIFGKSMAIRHRTTMAPAEWWISYGSSAKNLQNLAIKVLSLTCSTSGCERNWSVFENLYSKRRNRLEQMRLNDLVFIKYNRALRRRYNSRDTIDPISLKDIDESNEWLTGKIEGELNAEDEYVFDDDSLTWGDVTRAVEVGESSRPRRSMASSLPSVSRLASSSSSVNEVNLEGSEEEDIENYKSDDNDEREEVTLEEDDEF